jgi:Pyruvate/2-oxoacid:ferredoxin oxidoreductase delta subunit
MPFVVGIYEEQLLRMDEEMAALFERYFVDSGGGSPADGGTSVHRVIPVEQSVPLDLEIFPYERASELLDRARSWGVRDCICRVQQSLIGKGCDHTVENCLIFSPGPGAFDESEATRTISREEAQLILLRAADEGLVHSTMNQQNEIFYICNCCTCCCGVMRGVAEFGVPTAVARSDFRVTIAEGRCTGCGQCTGRCQFGALSKDGDRCVVDYASCVGCGVCVTACAATAMTMERRPAGEVEKPPDDFKQWMALRVRERGISIDEVS